MKNIKIENYFLEKYTLGYSSEKTFDKDDLKNPSTFELYGIVSYVAEAINQFNKSNFNLLMTPGENFCFNIASLKLGEETIKYANMANEDTLFENMRFIVTEGSDEVEVEGLYRLSAISLTKNNEVVLDFEAYDLIQSHEDIIPNEFTVYLDY